MNFCSPNFFPAPKIPRQIRAAIQDPKIHVNLGNSFPSGFSGCSTPVYMWGTSKQHMELQQPRNYDFRVSQFDPLGSQSGNDREMTTSPPSLRSKLCTHGEKLKYHPFGGSPLFYKAPPRQFQPPKCKLTPSKIQIVEGRFLCISIEKCRLEVANPFLEGVNLHIGGRQFTFWRPKLSWGCFIEKG